MIILVRYNGLPGGITRGEASVFEVIDHSLNLDESVYTLLHRHNYGVLFSTSMMSALGHHGFTYITGGTSTYKLPPTLLINSNHKLFNDLGSLVSEAIKKKAMSWWDTKLNTRLMDNTQDKGYYTDKLFGFGMRMHKYLSVSEIITLYSKYNKNENK
jgi:hypothetical protein